MTRPVCWNSPNSLLPSQLQLFVGSVNLKLTHSCLSPCARHTPASVPYPTTPPPPSCMLIVACVTCILAHCIAPPALSLSAWAFPSVSVSVSVDSPALSLSRPARLVPCGFLIYHIVYTARQKFDLQSPAAGHTWAHLILITHVSRLTHARS